MNKERSFYSYLYGPGGKLIAFGMFFFLCLVQVNPGFGQSKYLSGNYWVENYTKKDGLPEDIVINVTQDSKGYIWLITPYNLVKFDGLQFKTYSAQKQFTDQYIHFYGDIVEDNEGILWIPSIGHGLFSFDPGSGQFSNFPKGKGSTTISGEQVMTLVKDRQGNIWIGTTNGLNMLTKKDGKISIRQFSTGYPQQLLNKVDSFIAKHQQLVDFSRIGNGQKKDTLIELKERTSFFVACMGELDPRTLDYGGILNEKGDTVWVINKAASFPAGGVVKNRLLFDVVTLLPGKYNVFYVTDDNHAWKNWNAAPPERPDFWGIRLFNLPMAERDSLSHYIRQAGAERSDYFSAVRLLKIDSADNLWLFLDGSIERLSPGARGGKKLVSEKIALPLNFYANTLTTQKETGNILVEGILYHPDENKSTRCLVLYDVQKKTSQLIDEGVASESYMGRSLVRDKRDAYWLGTFSDAGEGLLVSEPGTFPAFKQFSLGPPTTGTPAKEDQQIWTVFENKSGYIWVGSRQKGLYKIRSLGVPVQYNKISSPGQAEPGIQFSRIAEDATGNIWLSSKKGSLFKYDPDKKLTERLHGESENQEASWFFESSENKFIISGNGHKEYQPGKQAFNNFLVKVPDSLAVFTLDGYGNYWAVKKKTTASLHGMFIYNGTSFQPIRFDSSFNSPGVNFFRNFYIGKNGNFWLCPGFDGIHHYRLDNRTKKLIFVKKYLLRGVDVFNVQEDEKGIVWAGVYNDGFLRLDPSNNTTRYFTIKDGLPSNFVFKVHPFENGFWLLTDLGTAFFDIPTSSIRRSKALDEYISQHIDKPWIDVFSDRGSWSAVVTTRSGKIALGVKDGFCLFDPHGVANDSTKPVLQIASLVIGGKNFRLNEVFRDGQLRLSHRQGDIEIEYIGLHYDDASKNQYSYFLKGADKDWVYAKSDRIARYANLPPGRYEFYLKSANAEGVWSDPEKMFSFVILPPWWKTWWAYTLYFIALAAGVWLFTRYRSRVLKKENVLLETKVSQRTAQLNRSIDDLKATQSQLIQSEKMASLGELTAGIAHEIQNPLNFVNNFSEVNTELIGEMQGELEAGNKEEAISISNNIKENQEKISHHGKRAEAIVKGMLQHSRSSTGQKEPTNINTLADEYLRLSYHGLRAKDKSFNAKFETHFDPLMEKTDMIPQDIGRVLLNLFNNAFYAVTEKKTAVSNGYDPTVTVTTRKNTDSIEVTVSDNGMGIPQSVVDKIFQPFFTTKPAGKGTGLGLSLSYDIIKAHGGELKVETKEGELTAVTIKLPANN